MAARKKTKPETERWLPIPGFGGAYDASTLGRIRSRRRGLPRILTGCDAGDGYWRVRLTQDGCAVTRPVHRLVLLAHVGPAAPGEEARHLNGIRSDNRLSNLAWGTHPENCQDRIRHGTQHRPRGSLHGMTRLTEEDARQIKEERLAGVPLKDIANRHGVSEPTVCQIARGRTWKHLEGAV